MIYKLDYQSESKINCTFSKIGTPEGLKRWTESKSSPSYTLVAYIKEYDLQPFQEIAGILTRTGHRFKLSRKLHCTLLSLCGNTTDDNIQSIRDRIESFFKSKGL